MKVSFDFDGTLSTFGLQEFAKELISQGIEVWIVTSRYPNKHRHDKLNRDLFKVADKLNIPKERIVFTSWVDKAEYFLENPDFIFHLDDDFIEIELMEERCQVPGIPVFANVDWKEQALTLLNETRDGK